MMRPGAVSDATRALRCLWFSYRLRTPCSKYLTIRDDRWPKTPEGDRFSATEAASPHEGLRPLDSW
eukprot:4714448-Prymnesium_polylepis.1